MQILEREGEENEALHKMMASEQKTSLQNLFHDKCRPCLGSWPQVGEGECSWGLGGRLSGGSWHSLLLCPKFAFWEQYPWAQHPQLSHPVCLPGSVQAGHALCILCHLFVDEWWQMGSNSVSFYPSPMKF